MYIAVRRPLMSRISTVLFFAAIFGFLGATAAAAPLDTAAIDAAIGRTGQSLDGGVYRVSFPRSDLHITVGDVTVAPGLALGGYAAFVPENGGTLAVGDLVLLEDEIQPVMDSLKSAGVEITALHNHLRGESPHVMYMHFMAFGDAAALAKQIRTALALSKTPLGPVTAHPSQALAFQNAIEQTLG